MIFVNGEPRTILNGDTLRLDLTITATRPPGVPEQVFLDDVRRRLASPVLDLVLLETEEEYRARHRIWSGDTGHYRDAVTR